MLSRETRSHKLVSFIIICQLNDNGGELYHRALIGIGAKLASRKAIITNLWLVAYSNRSVHLGEIGSSGYTSPPVPPGRPQETQKVAFLINVRQVLTSSCQLCGHS
jgi:hypothetical protein